ncbi:MAG: hypothetical protein J5643_05065 [Lachnospiraceae bacterium]|nr:hypothetical protein [Lachnospiraceae bacterium]
MSDSWEQNKRIQEMLLEAWNKAKAGWKCRAADAFQSDYVIKEIEISGEIEEACIKLENLSKEFSQKLDEIDINTLGNNVGGEYV